MQPHAPNPARHGGDLADSSSPGGPATSDNLHQAAHRYADAGWPVFPCQPGSKTPATRHGHLDASTSHAQIDLWWTRTRDANIGIATGSPGPDVLDIDLKTGRDGFTALRRAQTAGLIPSPIAAVRTPSGGAHLYYSGTAQRCGALPARALDFRAAGGFVIAPPSWSAAHRRRYRLVSAQPGSTTIDWAAIRRLLGPSHPRLPRPARPDDPGLVARLAAWLETRPEGNRNYPLFWAARLTATVGLMDAQAREQLIAASLRSGLRGGEREARRTLASGERAAAAAEAPARRIPPA